MTRTRGILLAGALALLGGLSPDVSSQGPPLTVGGFVKVAERRVTRTVTEYTFTATLTNGGGGLAGATATVTSVNPATVIVDGTVTFGAVGPGGSVVSTDTFTFRHERLSAFAWTSLVWSVTGTPANVPPVANAGPDQTAVVGQTVTLNGSGSSDANGDPLTYAWSVVSLPAGSAAALSDPTAVMPTFVVDRPGSYTFQLVVQDGTVASAPDLVTVSTLNTAPVANAGPDQAATVGQTVTLNGSGSSDADGDPLTYAWSVVSRPAGSTAAPSPANVVNPTVGIDRGGTYVFALVVHDGTVASAPDTVSISTVNTPPVANAGPDQAAAVGQTVTLDGSGSTDANGDTLTYAWSLTSTPAGSAAVLSDPTAVMPTFVVDRPGTYVAQLIVHDGTVASVPDTVTVNTVNTPPVANAGPDQAVVAGAVVLLDGSLSSDADGDPLTYAWSLVTVPPGSATVLTGAGTVTPTFVADQPGTYVVQLIVHDGLVSSAPDTVTVSTTNVAPVANAGPDQLGVPVGQVVTLDGSLSSDADGHPLTYAWAFTSKPAGSAATLSGATTVAPTFTPDLPGDYVVQLQVSDGYVTSEIDTVLIRTNAPPDEDLAPMTIGLVGTSVVGVGRTATMRVTLSQPAGVGGVLVSFVSSNPAVLTFSGPSSVTVPPGATTAQVTVQGVSVGDVTVTATATGYVPATASLPVTLNLITTPASLQVPFGGTASLPVTIGPNPAPPGGITVQVTSANSSIIEVLTATITIPEGQLSANAIVRGAGAGSATVTASHPSYSPSSTTVSSTGVLNILSASVTFYNGFIAPNVTVQLENGSGEPTPAPQNLSVTLTSANATCVAVPGTIVIPAGQVTAQFQPSYGGSATLPCTTTVTASLEGFSSDTVPVTVNPQPGINAGGAQTVGAWLQVSRNATLGTGQHGDIAVTVASSDQTRMLVSPTSTTAGAASFTINLAPGQTNVPYYVQGVEGTTGTATVTVSAPGFIDGTHAVEVVQPGIELLGLPTTTTTLSANDTNVYAQVGIPNAGRTALQSVQNVRAGGPAFIFTLANSNATVAQLYSDEPVVTGQVVTKPILAGSYYNQAVLPGTSYGLAFDPIGVGSTTVTVTGPAGVATMSTSGVRTVGVSAPGITTNAATTVGAGLQTSASATLGGSQHGGVTMTVTSSAPALVLVSPSATTAGSGSISFAVPNDSTHRAFYVQGLENVTGTAVVTVSAPGFTDGQFTVTVVPSGVEIQALDSSIGAGAADDTNWYAQVGIPNTSNTVIQTAQNVRGGSPGFVVTLSNSNGAVAQLRSDEPAATGQTVTKPIQPGVSYTQAVGGGTSYGLAFDPLASGSTTVTASGPAGVLTMTTNGVRTVTVTP